MGPLAAYRAMAGRKNSLESVDRPKEYSNIACKFLRHIASTDPFLKINCVIDCGSAIFGPHVLLVLVFVSFNVHEYKH